MCDGDTPENAENSLHIRPQSHSDGEVHLMGWALVKTGRTTLLGYLFFFLDHIGLANIMFEHDANGSSDGKALLNIAFGCAATPLDQSAIQCCTQDHVLQIGG
jgi:hypothetical protein